MRLYYTRSQGSYYKCERYVGVSGCLSVTSIFVIDLWWQRDDSEGTDGQTLCSTVIRQWQQFESVREFECHDYLIYSSCIIYISLYIHDCCRMHALYIFIPLATQFSPHVKVWYYKAFFMECIWSTTLLFNPYISRWVGWLVKKLTSLSLRVFVAFEDMGTNAFSVVNPSFSTLGSDWITQQLFTHPPKRR